MTYLSLCAAGGAAPRHGFRMQFPTQCRHAEGRRSQIEKLPSGESKKDGSTHRTRLNLGTFTAKAEAERHERAVQFFKRQG